jgi:CubicO group peptidase (beta-lactamase class C family)
MKRHSSECRFMIGDSKSLTAIVAGILLEQAKLDPEQRVVSIIPELRDSVYSDATVRHVLDMRVGLDFDEDYLATSGPIVEYRKSTNWNPLGQGERPSDLRTYLAALKKRSGPDGCAPRVSYIANRGGRPPDNAHEQALALVRCQHRNIAAPRRP